MTHLLIVWVQSVLFCVDFESCYWVVSKFTPPKRVNSINLQITCIRLKSTFMGIVFVVVLIWMVSRCSNYPFISGYKGEGIPTHHFWVLFGERTMQSQYNRPDLVLRQSVVDLAYKNLATVKTQTRCKTRKHIQISSKIRQWDWSQEHRSLDRVFFSERGKYALKLYIRIIKKKTLLCNFHKASGHSNNKFPDIMILK